MGCVPAELAAGPWGEGRLWLPVCLMSPCHGCPLHVLVLAEVDRERNVSVASAAALACRRGQCGYDAHAAALAAK